MPEAAARAARGRRLGGEPQGGDPASESPGTDRSPPQPLRGPPWDSWRTRACTPVCVSASDDGADGATRASLGRGAPRRGLPGGRVFRRRELSRCRLRPHREQHGWLRWAGSRDAQCGQLLPALLGQPGLHAGPSRGAGGKGQHRMGGRMGGRMGWDHIPGAGPGDEGRAARVAAPSGARPHGNVIT